MPLIPRHILLILPVDHDNVFRHLCENVMVIFEHIIPHHHASAEFFRHDLMAELEMFQIQFLLSLIRRGFLRAFRAEPDIPCLIPADMDILRFENSADLGKVGFNEFARLRQGRAENMTGVALETPLDSIPQFRVIFIFFLFENKFRVSERRKSRDHVNAARLGIFDDLFQFFRGISVLFADVKGFRPDTPFQIQKQRVIVVFGNEIDESFQELHRLHLTRQVKLDRTDFVVDVHSQAFYMLTLIQQHH